MSRTVIRFSAVALLLAVCAPTAAVAADDPVVATVNGEKILRSDVARAQDQVPEQYRGFPLVMLFDPLVNAIINTKLAAAEARKNGLHEDPGFLERMARIEDQVLQREAMTHRINDRVTDEALHERYDRQVMDMGTTEQVKARHIVVETEAEAEDLIQRIGDGVDFAELARKHSTGQSASAGGDLGYFAHGDTAPEFSDAAFAMEPGAISEMPVQTSYGWHVIKVEDRRRADPPTFEEARENLAVEMSEEIGAAYIEEMRAEATIERFSLDGSVRQEDAAK